MKDYLTNKRLALEQTLENISTENRDCISNHQKALEIAINTFNEVNNMLRDNPFPNSETEIFYFKFTCPYLLSEIFYYQNLLTHLSNRQKHTSPDSFKHYYKSKLRGIKEFFASYHDIICYHSSGHSSLDIQYFRTGSGPHPVLFEETIFLLDNVATNGYSIIIGKSIAYFRLKLMLKMELKNDQNHKIYTEVLPSRQNGSELVWTSQKVNLVELANALHAEGCFNNGNCDIAQIMCNLELAFNVSLGNFYDIYSNIKQRKKPTQFILRLQEKLQQKIEDSINQ